MLVTGLTLHLRGGLRFRPTRLLMCHRRAGRSIVSLACGRCCYDFSHALRLLRRQWRGFYQHVVANGEGNDLANPALFEQQMAAATRGRVSRRAQRSGQETRSSKDGEKDCVLCTKRARRRALHVAKVWQAPRTMLQLSGVRIVDAAEVDEESGSRDSGGMANASRDHRMPVCNAAADESAETQEEAAAWTKDHGASEPRGGCVQSAAGLPPPLVLRAYPARCGESPEGMERRRFLGQCMRVRTGRRPGRLQRGLASDAHESTDSTVVAAAVARAIRTSASDAAGLRPRARQNIIELDAHTSSFFRASCRVRDMAAATQSASRR